MREYTIIMIMLLAKCLCYHAQKNACSLFIMLMFIKCCFSNRSLNSRSSTIPLPKDSEAQNCVDLQDGKPLNNYGQCGHNSII